MKVLDAARQETLSGQLEELRKKEEQSAAESRENQEKMRLSLHDIRNQLHVRTLENENLRKDLESRQQAVPLGVPATGGCQWEDLGPDQYLASGQSADRRTQGEHGAI
jgi:hypothetical protein